MNIDAKFLITNHLQKFISWPSSECKASVTLEKYTNAISHINRLEKKHNLFWSIKQINIWW